MTVLHWFRRDLRLFDNTALHHAARSGQAVVPVYVVSDWQRHHRWTGPHRQTFLCESLQVLDESLRAQGGQLIVRCGSAVAELKKLIEETKAGAIYFNRDPDPFGRKVEKELTHWCGEHGVQVFAFQDHCLHERDDVLNGSGASYRVFTPYAKAWAKLPKTSPINRLPSLQFKPSVRSTSLPTLKTWKLTSDSDLLPGGEIAAKKRLKVFLDRGITHYGKYRDLPALDGTSRISQDLRFGLISIRDVYERCLAVVKESPSGGKRGAEIFIRELIWREFYMQILWHHPEILDVEFNPSFRGLKWSKNKTDFERWSHGLTGFPLVDAAMRQLNQTGFMPNRPRMITAMFLTKDLRLDWRMGERYFMQQLIDGEIASNNGGWQWSAGTGADAAPYFRIQNPWTQTKRFDLQGEYIKRWIPELRDVPPEKFWRDSDQPLAKGYPAPMVNHAQARARTLELFSTYRQAARSPK